MAHESQASRRQVDGKGARHLHKGRERGVGTQTVALHFSRERLDVAAGTLAFLHQRYERRTTDAGRQAPRFNYAAQLTVRSSGLRQ